MSFYSKIPGNLFYLPTQLNNPLQEEYLIIAWLCYDLLYCRCDTLIVTYTNLHLAHGFFRLNKVINFYRDWWHHVYLDDTISGQFIFKQNFYARIRCIGGWELLTGSLRLKMRTSLCHLNLYMVVDKPITYMEFIYLMRPICDIYRR